MAISVYNSNSEVSRSANNCSWNIILKWNNNIRVVGK